MARSISYWYNIMVTEKETMSNLNTYQPVPDDAQTFLNDLKGTSKVQSWRIAFWCVATAMAALDVLWDLVKIFLAALAAKSRYGTDPWYVQKAKEFQYGDSLVQIDLEWRYAIVNESAQVIKLASARSIPGRVNVKIATVVAGVTQPLPAPQYAAAKAYFDLIKPATSNVKLINDPPDEMRLFIAIDFDPLVLKANGELISSPGVFPAEDAVNLYRQSFGFDSRFELMDLVDQLQKATGVKTAYILNAEARYGTQPFVVFTKRYLPNAGYVVIDPLTPLSSSITYTASV